MTSEKQDQPAERRGMRRHAAKMIKWVIRTTVLALVGWGIWRTFSQAEADLSARGVRWQDIQLGWAALAGLFYLAGLAPCWLFWHRTLRAMGQDPRWSESLRAFWIGHLGKYVPGKAMVVVLRTGLVSSDRVGKTVAATSVFVETLTMMAVGAFLSAAILLATSQNAWLTALAVVLMAGAGIPTVPPIFRRLVRWLRVARADPQLEAAIAGVDYPLMLRGWIAIACGWVFLGLSLWATLWAFPDTAPEFRDIPLLVATVGLAMVAGFLSLVPGGLGVRDWLLVELLVPRYGLLPALASAILLRLIWLLSELIISAMLYVNLWRARRKPSALEPCEHPETVSRR